MSQELFRAIGRITPKGQLKVFNSEEVHDALRRIGGKDVEIIFLKREGTLSQQQRSYYFSVIVPQVQLAYERLGERYSREQIDHALRIHFLPSQTYNPVTDTWDKGYRRLNTVEGDVTTKEFSEFVENVIQWATETLEWPIPFPNEN